MRVVLQLHRKLFAEKVISFVKPQNCNKEKLSLQTQLPTLSLSVCAVYRRSLHNTLIAIIAINKVKFFQLIFIIRYRVTDDGK